MPSEVTLRLRGKIEWKKHGPEPRLDGSRVYQKNTAATWTPGSARDWEPSQFRALVVFYRAARCSFGPRSQFPSCPPLSSPCEAESARVSSGYGTIRDRFAQRFAIPPRLLHSVAATDKSWPARDGGSACARRGAMLADSFFQPGGRRLKASRRFRVRRN